MIDASLPSLCGVYNVLTENIGKTWAHVCLLPGEKLALGGFVLVLGVAVEKTRQVSAVKLNAHIL